jgi:hypothetical protein
MFTSPNDKTRSQLAERSRSPFEENHPLYPQDDECTRKQRLETADILDAIALEKRWNDGLNDRLEEILRNTHLDDLLAYAFEEVIHYSGLFSERNLFGFRVKPDQAQLRECSLDFQSIAYALRNRMPYEELEAARKIVEARNPIE